jgi:hypothetical protein
MTAMVLTAAAALVLALFHPAIGGSVGLEGMFRRFGETRSQDAVELACAEILPGIGENGGPASPVIVRGLESLPGRFRQASSPLRSAGAPGRQAANEVIPLAPLTACRGREPVFRWKGGDDSRTVRLDVFRRDKLLFSAQSSSGLAALPEETPRLEKGVTYHYTFTTADDRGVPISRAGPFFFTVLEDDAVLAMDAALDQIETECPPGPARDFFRSLILAEARVLGEALPILESLAEKRQGGAAVLMLLAVIQAGTGDGEAKKRTLERIAKDR